MAEANPTTGPSTSPHGAGPTPDYGATTTTAAPPTPQRPTPNPGAGSRIEPKVWLANERTFLNWCRTGLLLGSFGVVLLNSSSATGARIMGFVYSLIAVGTISYGHFLYKKRVVLIERKHAGHFDELIAPIVIASSLFTAVLINFILRVIDQDHHKSNPDTPKAPWIAAPASSQFS